MIVTVEHWATPPRLKIETTAASVTRVEGATRTPVRGSVVAGVIYDYEAPQETAVTYDDGLSVSAPVEMPSSGPWLIPAASPELGVRLRFSTYPKATRANTLSVLNVPGRPRAIAVDWGRADPTFEVQVTLVDQDEYDELLACLGVSGPMLLSTPPSTWQLASVAGWVVCGDAAEAPLGKSTATWGISFPVTPIDRPEYVAVDLITWETQPSTWAADVGAWAD